MNKCISCFTCNQCGFCMFEPFYEPIGWVNSKDDKSNILHLICLKCIKIKIKHKSVGNTLGFNIQDICNLLEVYKE